LSRVSGLIGTWCGEGAREGIVAAGPPRNAESGNLVRLIEKLRWVGGNAWSCVGEFLVEG